MMLKFILPAAKLAAKLVVLNLLLQPTLSIAETFSVIAYQNANPPYNIKGANEYHHSGIFVDMFNRISELTGDEFLFYRYPVSRALFEFDRGRVDIEPGVNEIWRQQRKVPGLYSIEYARSTEVVLFNPGKRVSVRQPADLGGMTVGVVRGYSYPMYNQAFTQGLIRRVDNVSEHYLLEQLHANRYDQIFIGYRTALYYMKTQPKYRHFEVGDVVSQVSSKIRVHPKNAHLLPRLNDALEQMILSGDIQRIYDKYKP